VYKVRWSCFVLVVWTGLAELVHMVDGGNDVDVAVVGGALFALQDAVPNPPAQRPRFTPSDHLHRCCSIAAAVTGLTHPLRP
jgi:hypothetical protein